MHGGLAPAQHIVVHTRHVVVHQRVGVNQLGGAARAQRRMAVSPHRLASRQNQQRAQAFAAVQHRVTHRLHQLGWSTMVQPGRRVGRHPAIERTFHPV